MYFYAFAYEYSKEADNTTYFDGFFPETDLDTFTEILNGVLLKCRMAPLYPADRFDWLILRSVREFEVNKKDSMETIKDFLNNVTEASFNF